MTPESVEQQVYCMFCKKIIPVSKAGKLLRTGFYLNNMPMTMKCNSSLLCDHRGAINGLDPDGLKSIFNILQQFFVHDIIQIDEYDVCFGYGTDRKLERFQMLTLDPIPDKTNILCNIFDETVMWPSDNCFFR